MRLPHKLPRATAAQIALSDCRSKCLCICTCPFFCFQRACAERIYSLTNCLLRSFSFMYVIVCLCMCSFARVHTCVHVHERIPQLGCLVCGGLEDEFCVEKPRWGSVVLLLEMPSVSHDALSVPRDALCVSVHTYVVSHSCWLPRVVLFPLPRVSI